MLVLAVKVQKTYARKMTKNVKKYKNMI